ncbi:MAG: TolC family protein [Spirochaetota bacterium]
MTIRPIRWLLLLLILAIGATGGAQEGSRSNAADEAGTHSGTQEAAGRRESDRTAPSDAETLSIPGVVPLILEHDSTYRRALLEEAGARASRSLARAQVLPQISLGTANSSAPTYGWSRTEETRPVVPEDSDGSTGGLPGGDQTTTETETVLAQTHTASAGLSLSQALPTDGSLSLSAGNTLRAQIIDDEDPQFRQDVSFRATWQQPLFTNRRVIDLRVFGASIELAGGIPLRLAQTSADMQKNARILGVLESYLRVVELRRQVALLERNIGTTAERVDQARIRLRQGTITQSGVWDVEVSLEELREGRLEADYALVQAESSLAASLGLDSEGLAAYRLADTVPTISLPEEEEMVAVASGNSTEVRQARESLSQAQLQRIVNGRQYGATLSTSVSVTPSYGDDWTDNSFGTTDFGESYTDLFSEDASWDTTVSVSLSVPLYDGRRAVHQAARDARSAERAALSLSEAQRSVRENIGSLYLRRRLLQDQLSLRETSLAVEEDRLAEQRKRAELESVTPLDIREAEAQVVSRQDALWRTRADLFLNSLRILQAAGRDLEQVLEAAQSGANNE